MKLDQAEQALTTALADPDVALHAGSALRRMIGNERAIERLIGLADANDERVARAAQRNLKLAQKALARKRTQEPRDCYLRRVASGPRVERQTTGMDEAKCAVQSPNNACFAGGSRSLQSPAVPLLCLVQGGSLFDVG